jgi:hypothetical protein
MRMTKKSQIISEVSLEIMIPESPKKPFFRKTVMVVPETPKANSLLTLEHDLTRTVLENHKKRREEQAKSKKGRKPKKVRKWTKPKDAPKRPLSAYNLFVRDEREAMLRGEFKSGTGVGRVAKQVAARWRELDVERKAEYEKLAKVEKKVYFEAVKEWKLKKQQQEEQDAQESFNNRMREYYQSSFGVTTNPVTPSSYTPRYPIRMNSSESYEPLPSSTNHYGLSQNTSPSYQPLQDGNTARNMQFVQSPHANTNGQPMPYNLIVEPKKVDHYQPLPYFNMPIEPIKNPSNSAAGSVQTKPIVIDLEPVPTQPKQVVIDLEPVEDTVQLSENLDDETVNFMSRLADGNFL